MARIAALLLLVPSVLAFNYTVGVGKDETTGKVGMGFDPSSVRPQAGDMIVFEYRAGSHSAVQSTFDNPCTPMSGGYDSGVQTVADSTPVDASGLPTTVFIVPDLNPVWFFDQAGGLCSKGAVFSINPEVTGTQTAGQFRANAEATDPSAGSSAPASSDAPTPTSAPASSSNPVASGSSSVTTVTTVFQSATPSPSANGANQLASFSMGVSLAALGAWLFI
ncbi:hypothetical protein BDV93DRAFT_517278 [Ceratobasidium sp. AG-I]|nr:hypothetical protein BDV93DRAFT_517278 [Ceratobasidium sp. AG-I]